MDTKNCIKCGKEKPLIEFPTTWEKGKIKVYYKSKCKDCTREDDRERGVERRAREDVVAYQKQYRQDNKIALNAQSAEYRKNHLEHLKALDRKYYADNKDNPEFMEKRRKQGKKSYDRNKGKPEKKIKANKYRKNKYETNATFKLRIIVSTSINSMLFSNGGSKRGQSIVEKLPYTIDILKQHIENLFSHSDNLVNGKVWMTWKNHGNYNTITWNDLDPSTWTWQIDHIIPHSKFNYTSMDSQEFQDCWALSNLRPLNAKQNIQDGNRR